MKDLNPSDPSASGNIENWPLVGRPAVIAFRAFVYQGSPLSLSTAIKTKSIYEPAAPEDGKRILITRYYPRGVKRERFDLWLRALSPTKELLASYRTGKKTWRDFERSFLSELGRSPESAAALRQVVELAEEGDLTLLCYERSGLPCHRTVVQRVLTNPTTIRHSKGRRRPG